MMCPSLDSARALKQTRGMTTPTASNAPTRDFPPIVSLMLNIGHGVDHMFLLIFATAVGF